MGEVQWIKLYLDIFDTNQKIKKLRRHPLGSDTVLIWIMLLVKAGRCNAGGHVFITEKIPYTVDDLADEFKFDVSTIEHALNAFCEFDMVTVDEDGFIFINGWEEYQSADKLAEMRAKDRERKRLKKEQAKALLNDGDGNSTEHPRNIHGTSTEIPSIEEDIEEKEKEEEIHSFVRSCASEEDDFSSDALKMKYLGGTLGQGMVLISEEQFHDLCDKLSLDELDKYMGIIVECEKNGQHFTKKTHYQAILDMVAKDRRIKK